MSPVLSLQSPVFLFYLALAASLLLVAGVILAVLKWGLRANIGHAWKAYCGWLFMVPLLILVFFLGREAAIVFLTIVAILSFPRICLRHLTVQRSNHHWNGLSGNHRHGGRLLDQQSN